MDENKTQSGSLFEGCRDVARAPEHNHPTHLFKDCVVKRNNFFPAQERRYELENEK